VRAESGTVPGRRVDEATSGTSESQQSENVRRRNEWAAEQGGGVYDHAQWAQSFYILAKLKQYLDQDTTYQEEYMTNQGPKPFFLRSLDHVWAGPTGIC
jgi:hypothetical protein